VPDNRLDTGPARLAYIMRAEVASSVRRGVGPLAWLIIGKLIEWIVRLILEHLISRRRIMGASAIDPYLDADPSEFLPEVQATLAGDREKRPAPVPPIEITPAFVWVAGVALVVIVLMIAIVLSRITFLPG
jgi:hypothetical protein